MRRTFTHARRHGATTLGVGRAARELVSLTRLDRLGRCDEELLPSSQ